MTQSSPTGICTVHRLSGLGKLSGTKTVDNSSTLLHYMAKLLEKDDISTKLGEELADLELRGILRSRTPLRVILRHWRQRHRPRLRAGATTYRG